MIFIFENIRINPRKLKSASLFFAEMSLAASQPRGAIHMLKMSQNNMFLWNWVFQYFFHDLRMPALQMLVDLLVHGCVRIENITHKISRTVENPSKKYAKLDFKKTLFWDTLSIYTKYPVKYEVQRSLFTMRNKIHKPSGWILRWMYSFEQDITQYWILASRESWISPIFVIFRCSLNFRRTQKIFLLHRFKKFWMFWKAMILIRSFLLSKSRRPRLRHPLVPLLWEDFGKIPISHLHHPNSMI